MNEIIVTVEQTQGLVTANFADVKKQLYLQMDNYRGLVYTEETAKSAKDDVATLRKVRKLIDDKRKEVKKAQMIPYEEFEAKAKELIQIIDDVINPINDQVSVFEEKRKVERLEGVKKYFSDSSVEVAAYLKFEDVFEESMLNSSTTAKSIKEKFDNAIESVKKDVATVKAMNCEIESKVLARYAINKSLSECVNMVTEHEKMKAEIVARQEQLQREADAKRIKDEADRIESEKAQKEIEDKKIIDAAIEKAKEEERRKIEQELAIQKAKDDEAKKVQDELDRIEAERLAKLEEERIEAERLELERLAKIEADRLEAERIEAERTAKIEEEKRIAAELKITEEKKKNATYAIKVTGLNKEKLNLLASYLKENEYKFESEVE